MYRDYAIMQAPGPAAVARRLRYDTIFSPRWKRKGVVNASGQVEALGDFIHETYIATGKRSYGGYRIEYANERNFGSVWKPIPKPLDTEKGRRFRAILTLLNGSSSHDVILEAWKL